jgi:hypothetical protein
MIRYLYGQKKFLEPIKIGRVSPRFSHIGHYDSLENDLMRDDETKKVFYWKKEEGKCFINGHQISNDSLASDIMLSIKPRHCFCLCLSSKKDSEELYQRFGADYCLAIDVNILMEYLNQTFSVRLGRLKFISDDITYYQKHEDLLPLTPEKAVFYKPQPFFPEAEHRIAMFYPESEAGFHAEDGTIIPFSGGDDSTHIVCNVEGVGFWKGIVVDTFEYQI